MGRYVDAGYRVASIDYRLAPETKLPEIVADVRDALAWVRHNANALKVDPQRIAVLGGSAGGYLTLMTGTFEQKPQVLVSFYGYGELIGDWLTKPHYTERRLVSREEALKQIEPRPISEGRRPGLFYRYTRQTGRWPIEVAGVDPAVDPDFFIPYMPERNVSQDFPPTMLLHGTKDEDVPYEKSVQMAKLLESAGVEHELITIEGAGHGFNSRQPEVRAAYARVIAFLDRHLKH